MTSAQRLVAAGAVFGAAGGVAISRSASAPLPPRLGGSVVNVRDFGAKGDGKTPDTDAIQRAVNAVAPGGTVRFPAGTYLIETDKGVRLKDDIRLDMESATLVGPNVRRARGRIFEIQGKKRIVISGGTLIGSRSGDPEWGVGILASDAEDLVIQNVWLRDFHHDGILLTGNRGCRRVTLRRCVAVNNRRTGLAIVHAVDVTVEDSTFSGTRGQSPEAGVNGEPNAGEEVRNLRFLRCWFRSNAGAGLYVHRATGRAAANATVESSVIEDNEHGIVFSGVEGASILNNRILRHAASTRAGITLGDVTRATVTGNTLEGNFRGIFSAGSSFVDIRNNTIVGTGAGVTANAGDSRDGIVCLGHQGPVTDCFVTDNAVRRVAGSGIVTQLVTRARLLNNTIDGVGQRAILMRGTNNSQVLGNMITAAASEPPPRRYDAIELEQSSHNNLVSTNTIRHSPGIRRPVGIALGCMGNQVMQNVVLP